MPIQIEPTSVPTAVVGEPYHTLIRPSGGVPPYSFVAPDLPDGLSIDDNGVIAGIPTGQGGHTSAILITDSEGEEELIGLTFMVAGVPIEATEKAAVEPEPEPAPYVQPEPEPIEAEAEPVTEYVPDHPGFIESNPEPADPEPAADELA